MNKDAFLRDLIKDYVAGMHCDIDGADFQDLLEKHGFIEEAIITKEECEEEWAREYGYEPGDIFYKYTKEMREFLYGET